VNITDYIFLILWLTNVFIYIHLRLLIKGMYPDSYQYIYGKSLSGHSIATSLRFIRFSFGGKYWKDITDQKILNWLQANRFFNCAIYLHILGGAACFLVAILRN